MERCQSESHDDGSRRVDRTHSGSLRGRRSQPPVLHARFAPDGTTIDQYRRLVRAAVFPDPLSQRPIRLRDATATIREYTQATGDVAGTIDLLLEFVEAGTEQAADLGYGDDAYFTALERKVKEILRLLDELPNSERRALTERIARLGAYEGAIGWGYGDFLADVAAKLRAREDRSSRPRTRRGPRRPVVGV